MGLFKKVFRPVRKIAKKIIPKEVRPFLPYIAAGFGPATAGLTGTAFAKAAAQKALMAAATSAATDEQGDPLRAGLLAITPDVIGAGATKLGSGDGRIAEFLNKTKTLKDGTETMSLVERAQALQSPETFGDYAKVIGGQTAIDQSAKFAEIRQDEIDEYNRSLQEQGVLDKTKRRTAIFNIYKNAGYEDDYVNSMLDRYGYDMGGIVEFFKSLNLKVPKGMKAMSNRKKLTRDEDEEKPMIPPEKPKEDKNEEDDPVPVKVEGDLAGGLMAAADGVQKAFGRSFGNMEPVPMLRFARGGEVEIEEQVDDLGIMDLMKDQGIPYGEQASYGFDDAMGETFEMFLDYKKKGTIPMEMEFDEFLELLQGRKEQGIKGTQVASGYKDDIEEMYEQYVFEMEEQGLEPMDFASFLRQARSGMAKGGRVGFTKGGDVMRGVDRGIDPLEVLDILEEFKRIKEKYGYEMSFDDYLDGEVFANGGKVKRRKKGEPADEVIETEEEIFLDKMPRPKRKGIMEVASGGIMNKNLLNTGMDKDMRGGGFIPEGTKEKADDVPARLSKNEFVMTADAVRAAGGGSVNKGAKRMYDLMYTLEAKV